MRQLIGLFWDICLLRKTPQDIPYSPALLGLVVVIGMIIDNINLDFALPKATLIQVAGAVLAHTALLMGSLAALLALMGYTARVVQTLSALLGSGLIISLAAMPLIILSSLSEQLAMALVMLLLMLTIWSLVVTMHIFRHALSINVLLAGLLAFGSYVLSLKVIDWLIPVSH
ncbi:MAG: hypothetical protein LJE73_03800 [Proteobacteria bacterium]|jgi:hypothetical protein|nr:hypothetical protein [Pseudomonadota bacterium]